MADPGNLQQRVQQQMVAAMKAGQKARTQVLRMVLSEIKAQAADHPDADPQIAVAAYAKKLRKAMAEYEKIQQAEQVTALKEEAAIVDEFLPKALDDAALEALVVQVLAGMGPVTPKESGKVLGTVLKAAGGSADAAKVRALLEKHIAASANPPKA